MATCFSESEKRAHVKEANGAVPRASGIGRRLGAVRTVGYTMSKSDRRGFGLRRTASSGAGSGENIVRTFGCEVNPNRGSSGLYSPAPGGRGLGEGDWRR